MNRKTLNSSRIVLLVLLMTFSALSAGITNIKAQTSTITSYTFLSVNPNPVGIGQSVQVTVWILPLNPYTRITDPINNRFHNITVTITAPDGTSTTVGPFTGDPNGNVWFTYPPNKVGSYTFKASYPGELTSPGQYLPSQSPSTTLAVLQNYTVPSYQDTPLPTHYWTNPVNGQNRAWLSISGDWLMADYSLQYKTAADVSEGAFNPYSQAPLGPHIMWTLPLTTGGLVGGTQGTNTYYCGPSYSPYFTPPIVMNGKLYYNTDPRAAVTGFVCVDLRTGQTLWQNNDGQRLTCGQEWNAQKYSYTTAGIVPYLWTTTWNAYDPSDGKWMFNFTSYPSSLSRPLFSDDGSMLVYVLGRGWLAMWNSSLIQPFYSGTYNWTKGLQWNVTVPLLTVPTSLYPILGISSNLSPSILGIYNNVLIAQVTPGYHTIYQAGYDINTGQQLWVNNYTQSILSLGPYPTYWPAIGDGVLAQFVMQTRCWYGYDVNTGALLWTSDPQDYPWGTWTSYYPTIAYSKLYSLSYDGKIHAFDIKTGKQVWNFSSGNSGIETSSGTYPFFYGPLIAGGVVYAGTGFETPAQPPSRGTEVFAINATTGQKIWDMNGMIYLRAIADGYLLGVNVYDGQLYCIGMGPSKTTVTAPQSIITEGSQILVTGAVTDISAGTKQDQVASNFPNGLPAVSDDSEGQFMAAAYMQLPMPNNIIGVPVHITAADPNGNYQDIGTAITDSNGKYGISWTPPVPGTYHVTATFATTNSYWGSMDTTYFIVTKAPSPQVVPTQVVPTVAPTQPIAPTIAPTTPAVTIAPTPSPAVVPPTSPSPTIVYAAIGVAIVVIIAAVAAIILRRRK